MYPRYIIYNGTYVKLEQGRATQVLNDSATPKISVHTNQGMLAVFAGKIGIEANNSTKEQFMTALNGAILALQTMNQEQQEQPQG